MLGRVARAWRCQLWRQGSAAQRGRMRRCCKTGSTAAGGALAVLATAWAPARLPRWIGTLAATLAARLLAAGFSGSETARMVNTALAVRAGSEASATLDAFTADLCSGGAAVAAEQGLRPASLCARGRAEVYETQSVPRHSGRGAGKSARLYVSPGDTMVLCSDGALAAGKRFLACVLAANGEKPPSEMAQAAGGCREGEKLRQPDDITVLAVRFAAAEGA